MTVRTISHVELMTEDADAALGYFVSAFGFTPVARAERPDRTSTLLRGGVNIVVTAPRGAGPVRDYLDGHGDGIADLAFTCDDPAEMMRRAIAAGARAFPAGTLGAPAVEGFGAVRHTLLPTSVTDPGWLPGAGWYRLGPVPPAGADLDLDHVAVCLTAGTLRDTVEHYERAFGFEWFSGEYIEVGAQAMDSIVVRTGDGATFTMIEPDPTHEPGQIDDFLRGNNGPGVQHLAFTVSDIVAAVRELSSRGVGFARTPGSYYDTLQARVGHLDEQLGDLRETSVLADRDEWGYLLQIFTRPPHSRPTLFYELIQRHDARGFGSNNIRALYEAVERLRAESLTGSGRA
ncbi:4-hydroxyphenylpyruvate dioxygenase [Plantactinospora sp. ZYX-F-223]|uniref:4-hydroxyphenylpyruvate dioxygenase n=1 Tax=Plantactinospora sp. ZYX-F-223 TaxID=3144103 RepID=UPI0031FD91D9